jgi:hypothetical protein
MRTYQTGLSRLCLSIIILSLYFPASGQKKETDNRDTLYLKSGQMFFGEFQRLKDGRFEFDIKDAALVMIKFDKVKTLKAVTHLYRVVTSDRKIYYGKLYAEKSDGYLRVISGDSVVILNFKTIASINFFDKPSFKTINGYLGAGYSYTRSSDIGRLNLEGLIALELKKWETTLSGSSIITYSDSIWSRDREIIALSTYYYLNASWYIGALLNYQRNIELGLARRFQEGVGIRYGLINRINFNVDLLSGIVLNQEKNLEGTSFPTSVELPVGFNMELYRFRKPEISFILAQSVFFSLTEKGRIRQDGNISMDWEIIDDLSLNLQFYHNYDSKPVGIGAKKLDYGTVIGFKYDMGKY